MSVLFRKFVKAIPQPITKEGIKETIPNYYNTSLLTAVKELVAKKHSEKTLLEMLQLAFPLLNAYYTVRSTLSVKLSEIRKIIKANHPEAVYKKSTHDEYFNLPEEERNTLKTNYSNKVMARNTDLIQIDPTKSLSKLQDLVNSDKPYEIGILLMGVSGSRPVDLFKNIIEKVDANHIKFSNLSKKRKNDKFSVVRPLLILNSDEFIKKLDQFKEYFDDKIIFEEEGRLSPNIITGMSKVIKKRFPELMIDGQTGTMMRKLYAVLSYEFLADKKKTNFNVWIKNVLGHDDLTTSFSYSTINLAEEKEEKDEEKKDEETPTVEVAGVYAKLPRLAPEADKMKLLLRIYTDNNKDISNAELRAKSGLGSRIVNLFLQSR